MSLDPFFEAMLKQLAEADAPAMVDSTPVIAREMYRAMQSTLPAPSLTRVHDADADGIPVRIYEPVDTVTPCIVFFHGGGWVIGDLETHDGVCRQLAQATGFKVVAVDYRLAPEHPFPAPLDDCYQATQWVVDNADTLGIDSTRIAVCGDSAGGNLSAAVCLKARDNNGPSISFQALIYPVTDSDFNTGSYRENDDGFMLTRAGMEWFFSHYVGENRALAADPLVVPLQAADLSGLPPACIITAEYDPLRDEGEAYAGRLHQAGVPVMCKRYDGMIHGFFGMTDLVSSAEDAMDLIAAQIRDGLS